MKGAEGILILWSGMQGKGVPGCGEEPEPWPDNKSLEKLPHTCMPV